MTTSTHSPTAVSYARSLLELAGDAQAPAIGDELGDIRQVIDANPTFALFLADPGIQHSQRTAVLERAFKGKVSPLMWNFLGVLNTKGRLAMLQEIAGAYEEMLDEKLGKVEVDMTVAHPMSEEQASAAKQKISAALGRDAVVHTYVDDSIIGGMILRIRDQLIDASVRYQLHAMKEQLLAKIPK
jgi:F-type H+-transporting ATPase subunit delta